jgi:hypothetical protein
MKTITSTAGRVPVYASTLLLLGTLFSRPCLAQTGAAAIHSAVERGAIDRVTKLLEANPKLVNVPDDSRGWTPLHLAVITGNVGMTELLIARGADLDARDFEGNTPLHRTVYILPLPKVAKVLLDHGAGPATKNKDGKTPLQMARENNCPEVAKLMQAAMQQQGKPNSTLEAAERLVRDLAPKGIVTPWQLRQAWNLLGNSKHEVVAPDGDPLSTDEEQKIRRLATHFEALDLPDNVKANPPAIKPGDIFVQAVEWEPDGAIITFRNYRPPEDAGDVVLFLGKNKSVKELKGWRVSVDPDELAVRGPRGVFYWIRPKDPAFATPP